MSAGGPLSRSRPRRPPAAVAAGTRPRMSRRCHFPPGQACANGSSHGATKHRPSGLPQPRLQREAGRFFRALPRASGPESPAMARVAGLAGDLKKPAGESRAGRSRRRPGRNRERSWRGPRPRAVRAFRRLASAVPRHDAPVTQEGSPAILAGLTPARNAGARKTCASGPILPSMVTNSGLTSPLALRSRDGPAVSRARRPRGQLHRLEVG